VSITGVFNPNQWWQNINNDFFIWNNGPVQQGWGGAVLALAIDPAGNVEIWGEGPPCDFNVNVPAHCIPGPSKLGVGGPIVVGRGGGGTWGAIINETPWFESLMVAGQMTIGTSAPLMPDTQLTVVNDAAAPTLWVTRPYDPSQGPPNLNQVPYLGFATSTGIDWYKWYGLVQEDSLTMPGGELQVDPYLMYINAQGQVSIQFEMFVNSLDIPYGMSIGLPAALNTAPVGWWGGAVIGGPVGIRHQTLGVTCFTYEARPY
jgi:hypothetical protein